MSEADRLTPNNEPSTAGAETIALGSRPKRVVNHAVNPRLITYSLSEDGDTLIIRPFEATGAASTERAEQIADRFGFGRNGVVNRAECVAAITEATAKLQAEVAELVAGEALAKAVAPAQALTRRGRSKGMAELEKEKHNGGIF